MMTEPELTGAAIRAALRRAGTTQQALASRLGVSQGWVSKRVRGDVSPTVKDLARIAAALNIELTELLPVAEMARQGEGAA